MKRDGFHMQPGQYVFLLCPKISRLEWHPFTLTSAPDEDHFSVHIRTVGDWTNALVKAVGADKDETMSPAKLPRISVDGPFGTASIDIFKYEVGVCIGAGIGVTPFASILKSIWYKVQRQDQDLKLQKVYFFWVCSDFGAFEWFQEMLAQVENDLTAIGKADFLEYHIYLSRGWDPDQAKNIYLAEEQEIDAVTGLRQKTNYGRPIWHSNFKQIADDNKGQHIGVFFCGPKPLSKVLHKCCNNYTSREAGGTIFFYNKENF
ncbi:NADPH oxidase 3-like [Amphiura filiformis]